MKLNNQLILPIKIGHEDHNRPAVADQEEPGSMSFSENIEESPMKKGEQQSLYQFRNNDEEVMNAGDEKQHFKIYEFSLNENNAKSVISSTDRKKPFF